MYMNINVKISICYKLAFYFLVTKLILLKFYFIVLTKIHINLNILKYG